MTEREKIEREIILDILAESSKWRITEDDQNEDCIRLEVMDRARRLLLGVETVDANGYAQSHPANLPSEEENLTGSDYREPEPEKLNSHLPDPKKAAKAVNEWKSKRVRCQENGHTVWRPLDQCHKEKLFPNNPNAKKFRWVWDGPQDKKEQEDAMWAEHEAGNASC